MIDIENIVIDTVQDAVASAFGEEYPNLAFYSEYVEIPSDFPCVTLVESDNSTYRRTQDDDLQEHNATLMYECNVYTTNMTGKKALAKQIADVVDNVMQGLKFTRITHTPMANQDRTIYRIVMRYTAVVGRPVAVDGVETYPMYRQ